MNVREILPPGVDLPQSGTITMFSTTWCGYCRRLKGDLNRAGIGYTEVNIEEDESAAERVMAVNGGRRSVPTLVYGNVAHSLSGFRPQKLDAFLAEAGL